MREIKFRGVRVDPTVDKWIYGDLSFNTQKEPFITEHPVGASRCCPVEPDTLGQFTGLLDSNGNEIYEGDILRFAPPLRWEEDERRVGVVVYKYFSFVVKYNDMYTGLFNLAANEAPYTIIGNVHDNPDLLEAEHD